MGTLKLFIKFAIIFIILYILFDLLIIGFINTNYKYIERCEINVTSPKIDITEAKATSVNGYIKGNIFNDTGNTINQSYIKIEFYSKKDVIMGTKYLKLDNFAINSTKNINVEFSYKNVEYIKIDVLDGEIPKETELILDQKTKILFFGAGLLALYLWL